jgi:Na+-translocating ferredoxin:NAD+ oxidoreductase subunit B
MPSRREFIDKILRGGILAGLSVLTGGLIIRSRYGSACPPGLVCGSCSKAGKCDLPQARSQKQLVWQLNPSKCIQCGRCATNCVLTPSAVKCMHVFAMCGYCDLCGGYLKAGTTTISTAAENQLCPTNAIKRRYVEDPYYEYTIDKSLCIGCGKCVKGCGSFGNGSLQLQVDQNVCVNCNQCAIARGCPSEAYSRVPADKPYLLKGFEKQPLKTLKQQPGT